MAWDNYRAGKGCGRTGQGRAEPIAGLFVTCPHGESSSSSRALRLAVMPAPMARYLGAGGCPNVSPVMGWYHTPELWGRMHGQIVTPGFLLGHCPMASGGQLEHFEGMGFRSALLAMVPCSVLALRGH